MLKALSESVWLNKRLRSELHHLFSLSYGGVFLLGVFLSRAVLLGEIYPFGVGFFAGRCIYKAKQRGVAFLGVLLGTLFTVDGWPLIGYLLSLCAIYAVFFCYQKEDLSWLTIPSLIFAIHLLARGSIAFFSANELYLWIEIFFESIFVSIFAMVTLTVFQSVSKLKEGGILTVEEITSFGLIIMGIIIGVGELSFFGYSLQSILSRWLVLWGALLGGPGGGAAIGVAVGLVPSVQGVLMVGSIAYYALGGLLGGIFYNFQKIGVIVGFALANLFLSFFYTESVLIVQALKETGVAVLIFLLFNLPIKKEASIAAALENSNSSSCHEDIGSYYSDKLGKMAEVFYQLERVLREKGESKLENNKLNLLFNKATGRVCTGCSLKRICWEQDFYKTYRAVLEACTKLETNGLIEEKDFNADFKRRCMRLRELCVALNSQLEVLKLISFYEQQLALSNYLVNRQLIGLAKIVESFSEEILQKLEREENLEHVLTEKLAEKGLYVHQLSVVKCPGGEKEIHITQKICQRENWCTALVAPNVSQILDRMYILKSRNCSEKRKRGLCSYVLVPNRDLQVTVGKAYCPKEGLKVSGDLCSALTLPHHKFALIMCDGMGVGTKAYAESSLTVNILEKLLLAGFAPQTAVKTVNTALLLKSTSENFATLDVVIIDQISGCCDFIKIGGAPTLIRSARGVKVIQSSSPPVGILEEIEPQIYRHYLGPRNNIIMMSDGLWDALESMEKPEERWDNLLAKLEVFDPQMVADYLLFQAKKAAGNQALDDMCVMVACLEKRD
ncbi:MAG: stage II sporulation protein E [Clostridia bacterium]|nr:stage II sporulation protein E [Clostridia bacterium]